MVAAQVTAPVTVCIPTHPGRDAMLARAVASVEAQTVTPAAVMVCDDADGDGAAVTRNRALFATTTEWVAFLDSDDELYPHHLEALLECAAETGADLVYPWFDLVELGAVRNDRDPLKAFGRPFDPDDLRTRNYIPVTFLCRRELAVAVGGFPVPGTEAWPYETSEDWGFLLAVLDAGATIVHLPERTWRWHHHGANTSGRPWR